VATITTVVGCSDAKNRDVALGALKVLDPERACVVALWNELRSLTEAAGDPMDAQPDLERQITAKTFTELVSGIDAAQIPPTCA